MSGEDDWLREDLRELKGTLADLGKDTNAVLLRVVGVEHRLGTAEERLEALKCRQRDGEACPTPTKTTNPGAAMPVPLAIRPPLLPPAPPSVLPLAPQRMSLLEALAASQVKLLARPVVGPVVGLFYLAAAAALVGALLGIPAEHVRDWWGVPDTELDDDGTDNGGDDDAYNADDDAVPSE